MKIGIIVPMHNQHDYTTMCIESFWDLAENKPDIVVIDNNSSPPYHTHLPVTVVYNEQNQGVLDAYKQGMQYLDTDIVIWVHNDVIIHERNWDTRIVEAFEADEKLGLMGLFGGRGVGFDGGRGKPESNMQGKVIGTPGNVHGNLLQTQHPAVVFDSYCMIYRKDALDKVGIDPEIPIHHWFDRIITLDFVLDGWHCATIGIAHDHEGGITSTVTPVPNDEGVYNKGLALFQRKFRTAIPKHNTLWVDKDYNYYAY